jgi:hypothetical protein
MSEIISRPYHPAQCCEACVFGRGEHADWCRAPRWITRVELEEMSLGELIHHLFAHFAITVCNPMQQAYFFEPRAEASIAGTGAARAMNLRTTEAGLRALETPWPGKVIESEEA